MAFIHSSPAHPFLTLPRRASTATCARQPRVYRPRAAADTGRTVGTRVCVEYCTGCRWGLRASWTASELLVTFEGALGEVALRPSASSGTFRVWVVLADAEHLVWCRTRDGGFPELKVLKQHVRDVLDPARGLGHSDRAH